MDDRQPARMFYELNYSKIFIFLLSYTGCGFGINVLNRYQKSEFSLKQGRKISDFCLKQGQGIRMRGWAASPAPKDIWTTLPPDVMKE